LVPEGSASRAPAQVRKQPFNWFSLALREGFLFAGINPGRTPMARTDKSAVLTELENGFRESNAALLTEYRGLTVAQLKQLRRSLAGEAEYAVVKNTLTKIAANRAGVEGLDDLLVGPSAVAFVKGDPITVAKALKAFAKENPKLVIKGGFYEGKVVDAAEVQKLASLESREVLLSKVAGVLMATLAKAVRTVDALRIKLEEEQGAPAAVAAPAEAAPAETPEAAETPAVEAVEDEAATETSAEAPAEADAAEVAEEPAAETAETPEA
jgi:large subunit ribosomal protein L10